MENSKVLDFVTSHGWSGAEYEMDWNGYNVYSLLSGDDVDSEFPPCVGYPLVLLVKEDEIRVSTPEESLEYMQYYIQNNPDYADEEDFYEDNE